MKLTLPVQSPLERALFLRSLDLFDKLRARELAVLAQLTREHWLRRGTVVQEPGQRVRTLHLIVDGRVRYERDGGPSHCVEAPEAVGLVEMLAQVETRSRVITESNALSLVIDGRALRELIEDQFSLFLELRAALARQVLKLRSQPGVTTEPEPEITAAGGPLRGSFDLVEQLLWLRGAPHLGGFGPGVLAAMIRDRGELRLGAGETLWERDTDPTFLVVVVEGTVRCEESDRQWQAGSGAVLGLEAAFCGIPHAYTAVGESDVLALRISVASLLDAAEDHFHVAFYILAYVARLLLLVQESVADASCVPLEAQEAVS